MYTIYTGAPVKSYCYTSFCSHLSPALPRGRSHISDLDDFFPALHASYYRYFILLDLELLREELDQRLVCFALDRRGRQVNFQAAWLFDKLVVLRVRYDLDIKAYQFITRPY